MNSVGDRAKGLLSMKIVEVALFLLFTSSFCLF